MGVVAKVLKGRRNDGREYYTLYLPKSVYELIGEPVGFEFRLEKGKLVLDPILDEAEYKERKESAKKGKKNKSKG